MEELVASTPEIFTITAQPQTLPREAMTMCKLISSNQAHFKSCQSFYKKFLLRKFLAFLLKTTLGMKFSVINSNCLCTILIVNCSIVSPTVNVNLALCVPPSLPYMFLLASCVARVLNKIIVRNSNHIRIRDNTSK